MSLPDELRADEIGLDPEDWESIRALGHRMVDDMLEYLRTVGDRPAWRPVPAAVRSALAEAPIPREAADPEAIYRTFRETILPYPSGNIHPRFWGWVTGTGTPIAMLAEMLAAGMNTSVPGWDQSAASVEDAVLSWFAELLGFPKRASGLLVSGGTMANLVGIATALHDRAGFDVRARGLQDPDAPRLALYASGEVHSCVPQTAEILGLGRAALRTIPVDAEYRMDVAALDRAIGADRLAGRRPFCVVATAGTVNTGATDDLRAIADLCAEHGVWLHVDGAFGALVALSPRLRPVVAGLERADSVAFDLHKWGSLPYEVGCVLVRDPEAHTAAFARAASYLDATTRGLAAPGQKFSYRGIQLSRGFRALKVWMALQVHGVDRLARVIEQNVDQAAYFAGLVAAEPRLELAAPVPLNVVCFRYVAPGLEPASLDALNREILDRIQESGEAMPSHTRLHGRFVLRVANVNHRSRRSDFERLVRAVVDTGAAILGGTPVGETTASPR